MYIECLIQRSDGSDTFVDFEQVRYRFSKNAVGDHVCFVGSEQHQRRLLAMGSTTYRQYENPSNLESSKQGNVPEPMTRNILRKKNKPESPRGEDETELEAATREDDQPEKPVLYDYDWDLNQKVAKVKLFKFLTPDQFKGFIEENRKEVMTWPIDVRRELAKKLDKMMPDDDPDIEGFIIDDYLRGGSSGDT